MITIEDVVTYIFIIQPFAGLDFFVLKFNLFKIYAQFFPKFRFKVIFKVDRRISSFFRVKDVIPVKWKSHVPNRRESLLVYV